MNKNENGQPVKYATMIFFSFLQTDCFLFTASHLYPAEVRNTHLTPSYTTQVSLDF